MTDLPPARKDQLAEIWRVAFDRYSEGSDENLVETPGPLGAGSLKIGLRIVEGMFVGKPYAMTMPPGDTDYFLDQINAELGAPGLALALRSIEQHLNIYASANGKQAPVVAVYDRWLAKSGAASTFSAIDAAFAGEVTASLALSDSARAKLLGRGDGTPQARQVLVTLYDRNPHVVAAALKRARGSCEACGRPAPFKRRSDGSDCLEVHHSDRLADGGKDRLDNVKALCPNCHREAHHGVDAARFRP